MWKRCSQGEWGLLGIGPGEACGDKEKRKGVRHPGVGSVCSLDPPSARVADIAAGAGLVANPIVWASLVSVKTTGGGLPAGPFGLLGEDIRTCAHISMPLDASSGPPVLPPPCVPSSHTHRYLLHAP